LLKDPDKFRATVPAMADNPYPLAHDDCLFAPMNKIT